MKRLTIPLVIIFVGLLFACGGGGGSDGGTGSTPSGGGGVSMQKVSDADFQALSDEDQFSISNKLTSTLFKGVAADAYFDFSNDVQRQVSKIDGNYLKTIELKLSEPLAGEEQILFDIEDKYDFDERSYPLQYPLALLFEYPLSREYFEIWMAYILVNTILFSPAAELETCDYTDAQDIFYRLVDMIGEGSSINDIVYAHMISQENWRRFRSPEDNTREMMEIFLQRFNDEEVPLAAQACRNWSLTDESMGYQLVIGFNDNTAPLEILDTEVLTCEDFFLAVAFHDDLIPGVAARIVDVFFAGYPEDRRKAIAAAVVASNPLTFKDIFSQIIFSREYLINNERPKSFEETFFSLAQRIDWVAPRSFFKSVVPRWTSSSYPHLHNMKQATMTYKLGRSNDIPLDTLSFSFYHKAVRERLCLDRKTDPFNDNDGGWQAAFIETDLKGMEYIDYLFLSLLGRTVTKEEMDELWDIMMLRGHDDEEDDRLEQAMVVMDYCSRLPEMYYMPSFN